MTGATGALVALGVVAALVLGLAVRPPARRAAQALAELRADTGVRLTRLRALDPRTPRPRAEGPSRLRPSTEGGVRPPRP